LPPHSIYPPAPSLEAPLTAGEYFAGKTAKPKLVDLESGSVTENKTPITAVPLAAAAPSPIDTTSHTREPPSKSQTAPPALASPQVSSPAPPAEEQIVEPSRTAKELEIEQVDEDEEESSEPAIQHGIVRAEEAANTESADAKEVRSARCTGWGDHIADKSLATQKKRPSSSNCAKNLLFSGNS
jgi:coronin-1B/1C/6